MSSQSCVCSYTGFVVTEYIQLRFFSLNLNIRYYPILSPLVFGVMALIFSILSHVNNIKSCISYNCLKVIDLINFEFMFLKIFIVYLKHRFGTTLKKKRNKLTDPTKALSSTCCKIINSKIPKPNRTE